MGVGPFGSQRLSRLLGEGFSARRVPAYCLFGPADHACRITSPREQPSSRYLNLAGAVSVWRRTCPQIADNPAAHRVRLGASTTSRPPR